MKILILSINLINNKDIKTNNWNIIKDNLKIKSLSEYINILMLCGLTY